jgi:hypothetical protein
VGPAAEMVRAANDFLNARLGNSEIDMRRYHTPHVTLYLTAFSCPPARRGRRSSVSPAFLSVSGPSAAAGLSCVEEGEEGEGGRSDQKVKEIGKRGRQEFSIPDYIINMRAVPKSAKHSGEAGERSSTPTAHREEHTGCVPPIVG